MKTLYILVTYLIFSTNGNNVTDVDADKQAIKALEAEKSALFKQINTAIDVSIKYLRESNDSDANDGIRYMQELKDQLTVFNATDFGSNETDTDETGNLNVQVNGNQTNVTLASGRRAKYYDENDRIRDTLMKYSKLAASKGISIQSGPGGAIGLSKKKRKRLKNQIEVEKKLSTWLEKREKEKEMIKQYKMKLKTMQSQLTLELCPNYGVKMEGKGKKKKNLQGIKYPCCRKCCKSSYMGCL